MPIFRLSSELLFPPVELSEPDGILAAGGDLSVERLLLAYRSGIFPWYSSGEPILWWSPDPRFVLFPEDLHISKSLKKVLNSNQFEITFDKAFPQVISHCRAKNRPNQEGTWITKEMIRAYVDLHRAGYAHSVEAWKDGILAGGLYGVSIGRVFFGESMFYLVENASKIAFVKLVEKLRSLGFLVIDSQVYTKYLETFGAKHIPREKYLEILQKGFEMESIVGNWGELMNHIQSNLGISIK